MKSKIESKAVEGMNENTKNWLKMVEELGYLNTRPPIVEPEDYQEEEIVSKSEV